MENKKRYNIKNILLGILWVVIGTGTVMFLAAAIQKKDSKECMGIDISISGASNNFFIDKSDIKKIITRYAGQNAIGKPIDQFNLVGMETALKRDVWIKNAELYFDNNEVLQVTVEEREPVARVFTPGGSTFYIDSSRMMLPLSEKFSARVPVFTGFPSEVKILTRIDSSLLNDIKNLSMLIHQDSFLMALIDQVDITDQRTFELIPKLGNQVIVFGDASDAVNKFKKLQLFYKKVITNMGWNRYSIINLQYKDQVVAKIKGADDVSADSLRTRQMMEIIAANAAKHADDSTHAVFQDERKNNDISIIQQSFQREETGDSFNADEETKPKEKPGTIIAKPVVKPELKTVTKPVTKPALKATVKPIQKPPVKKEPIKKQPVAKPKTTGDKPKILMPKKNNN